MVTNDERGEGLETTKFVPALVIVDVQEDFCPPNGSLQVQDGRSIAPLINTLLNLPRFSMKIATQDYHPRDHISFATNHPSPNNMPFISFVDMRNPAPGKQHETKPQQLWPVHCVAGTPGSSIIPEVNMSKIDMFVKKGMDARVEMYSAFSDNFGNLDPVLAAKSVDVGIQAALRDKKITDVFVVGLAGDYCVKFTAIDAARAGYKSWVIEEATRCVVPGEGWEKAKLEIQQAGASVVSINGPEVDRLRS